MDIATVSVSRRHYRRRPLRSRPDQPLFDGRWRRYMTASLARKVGALPPAKALEPPVEVAYVGDPRTCWTPPDAEGSVWPQPARGFA